jgi:hypothetical protein
VRHSAGSLQHRDRTDAFVARIDQEVERRIEPFRLRVEPIASVPDVEALVAVVSKKLSSNNNGICCELTYLSSRRRDYREAGGRQVAHTSPP